MNILFEKNDIMMSFKTSNRMRDLLYKNAAKQNLSVSMYLKIACAEKIARDKETNK